MKKLFYWLLALAVVTTLVVEGIYLYKFGSVSNPTLSSDMSKWGQFGDYIGGTLGTYFGFLAFIGVLFTVLIQHDQLEHMRSQSKIEEIQRLLATISAAIDSRLHAMPQQVSDRLRARLQHGNASLSVFSMLSALGTMKLSPPPEDYIVIARRNEMFADVHESIRHDAPLIVIELQQLVRCLELHAAHSGSDDIQTIYRERYQTSVCWLDILKLLSSERVERYFKPKDFAKYLRPAS